MGECPNCQSTLSSGIFSKNRMLSAHELALINVVLPDERHGELCQKCGEKPLRIANMNIAEEIERIESEVRSLCQRMIVMHGNPPYSWDYFIIQRFSHYQDVSSDITLTSKQMKKNRVQVSPKSEKGCISIGCDCPGQF